MRGYVSFMLAFCCVMLLLSLAALRLSASDIDLSSAIALERVEGASLNLKEAAAEAARQGAAAGFAAYDSAHSVGACRHCPDSFCSYAIPPAPPPPGYCDALLCSSCFREGEARAAAESGAAASVASLPAEEGDVELRIGQAAFESSLRPDPLGRNGFALDYVRLKETLELHASLPAFGISLDGRLPSGMVIR